MAIFTIETPGGRKLKIEAETEEAALEGARQWHESQQPKAKPVGPVFQPASDFIDPQARAWKALGKEVGKGADGSALALGGPVTSFFEGISNQITGPASRALAKYGPPAYERPAAPWDERFGEPARKLEGADAATALKGDLDTAMMGMRPGAKGLKPLPPKVAKPLAPEVRAARAIRRAQQRDLAAGAGPAVAPGALPIHRGGENLTAMADVLANSPGPGRGYIRQKIRDHEATSVDRVKGDIATEMGGKGDYFATMEAKQAERAAKAKPLMEAAFAAPIDPVVFSEKIQPILGRLPKGSLEQAYDIARRDGRNPVDIGFEVSPASGDIPAMVTVKNPTTETLHYVKKGMDQTLEQYRNPVTRELDLSGSPGAQVDSQVRKTLARTMRDINPQYDEAMKVWGDDAERINALELGRNVFSPKMDMKAERLRGMVDDLSEAAREDFRKGVGEAVLDRVRGSRGDVGAMRDILKSEEFGDRVALAFPDDQSFARFMDSAARRVAERDVNSRIMGGSPTDPRQAARADLEAEGPDMLGVMGDVLTGDVRGLGRKGAKAAIDAIPRRSRSVIGDPEANLAASKALMDEDELTALLNTLQAVRARRARLASVAGRAAPLLLETGAAQSDP
jgi:hypothetical protein